MSELTHKQAVRLAKKAKKTMTKRKGKPRRPRDFKTRCFDRARIDSNGYVDLRFEGVQDRPDIRKLSAWLLKAAEFLEAKEGK